MVAKEVHVCLYEDLDDFQANIEFCKVCATNLNHGFGFGYAWLTDF